MTCKHPAIIFLSLVVILFPGQSSAGDGPPVPLLSQSEPVAWWFAFKFNARDFEGCPTEAARACPFGGDPQDYSYGWSQQFVYASSRNQTLTAGKQCLGGTDKDPVGATFGEIYNGTYNYVVWNDQFYEQPYISGCTKSCSAPWGHSKGVVAWDDSGNGVVMQVTTPAWPGSGNVNAPRENGGNTLGCVSLDDDIAVAQHFFSLRLSKSDVLAVLSAIQNSSVVTDTSLAQLVSNGGPADIQAAVAKLGEKSSSTTVQHVTLSSGVELISKPSALHVPPWQMVSAKLGGVPLRTATWWAKPKIYSTDRDTEITCWDDSLGTPGPVAIATSGSWNGTDFSLEGGFGNYKNHAKFGVEDVEDPTFAIFGDMNQQGALIPGGAYEKQKCSSSQNGRGGTFFVVRDRKLAAEIAELIKGDTAGLAYNKDGESK